MPKYEVAVYNEDVKKCVAIGESHERYEDSWSETHYIDVMAPNLDIARAKISKQYPPHQGFVIEQIAEANPLV